MYIAIAAHDLYPDPGSGGSGRYIYETGRRLVERGHEVTVLTRRRGDVPTRETVAGMDVHRYDLEIAERHALSIGRRLPRSLSQAADHVGAFASRDRPDVLSLQGPVTGPLLSALAADSIPRSCTFHSAWPAEYRLRTRSSNRSDVRRELNARLRHAIEGRTLASCDGIVTLSAFMRDRLLRTYDGVCEPAVIPGGVDLERYAPDVAATDVGTGLPIDLETGPADAPATADGGVHETLDADATTPSLPGEPAFLTVRRLSERMGHGLLLEAFAAVRNRHPEARLCVAGDGPLRERLERTAARLGIDDAVTFLGYVPDDDLPAVYAAADCFVLPTTDLEGFGLATLEALAAGTPVFGTPVGATPEVIGGLSAIADVRGPALARSVGVAALTDGMCAWASLSTAARNAAGRAGRRYVERRYPWRQTVTGLETHFETLAN
ncbi:glycosyltransferase family 4 protein [Natrinema sp. 74]|uniref:glycosyltransferase family 4 protein n=1 Tax=Natrinema sp. 74 TaxID=3384159 RepID=UPI0038D4976C